ncbi:Protein of unknown function [Bacillus cytotoxicus]|uniref:Uncharacterized protein n=1 Tax=Bacillus cytotoxicus TaxID=580165 RepID=A0AAX2CNM3_9BACI|nr:Protein of unknown function [Bacillus cytotoxicus]SCN42887.1 Protein of unknown function [Bacillus cytotoxicus]
MMVKRKIELEV